MDIRKKAAAGIAILGAAVLGCCGLLRGDCGSISFSSTPVAVYVDVFEPDQRAIIAWNGREEILILSTDLQASDSTKVLEVIPMPSEPKVTKGDVKAFKAAVDVLNSKLPKRKIYVSEKSAASGSGGGGGGGGEVETPPVAEVTFHEKIGAADISVVHVLTQKGFIEWVETYLKGQNAKNAVIPDIMKKTVEEYLADGYGWFAFNVVSLDKTVKSKEAVQYRFKTDSLFYPMRISRTDKGNTHISLTILTKDDFDNLAISGMAEGWLTLAYDIVTADGGEIAKISRDAYGLLGRPFDAKLRVWETTGKLDSFDQDIVVGPQRTFSLQNEKTGEVYGPFPLSRDAAIRVGSDTFALVVRQQDSGRPFQFDLEAGNWKSTLFEFADGAKVGLPKRPCVLKLGKPPVAKDPTAKAEDKKSPAAKPGNK